VAEKFKMDFEEGMKPINVLKERMQEFIPFLQNKAQIVEQYLGQ
jgi:hypothetical protein